MAITIDRQGQRVYLIGDTFPIKDKIKSIGGHWDGDKRAWWVGAAKESEARTLIDVSATAQNGDKVVTTEDLDSIRLVGKGEYKGRSYYIRWMGICKNGQEKARLVTMDGKLDFWADMSAVKITKTYQPREYRGRTEYTTLGSIKKFIEKQSNPSTRRGQCTECGEWGRSGETCQECHEGCFC